ncbi:MAG: hypothetical protein V1775_09845 [Bacteroidota bacterium]
MKAFILALTGLVFLFSSCQLTEQPKEKNTIENGFSSNKIKEVYAERDKNSNNFLFLNYWAGMSKAEFDIITDALISTEYLNKDEDGVYFTLNLDYYVKKEKGNDNNLFMKSCDFTVYPEYIGIDLYRINLVSRIWANNEIILDMYKNKYGKCKEEKPELIRATGKKPFYKYKQFIWELDDSYITITEEYGIQDVIPNVRFRNTPIVLTSFIICYETKLYHKYKSRLTKEREQFEESKIKNKRAIEKTKGVI